MYIHVSTLVGIHTHVDTTPRSCIKHRVACRSICRQPRAQIYIYIYIYYIFQAFKPVSSHPTSSLMALDDWFISCLRLISRSTGLWLCVKMRAGVHLTPRRWRCGSPVQSSPGVSATSFRRCIGSHLIMDQDLRETAVMPGLLSGVQALGLGVRSKRRVAGRGSRSRQPICGFRSQMCCINNNSRHRQI